MTLKVTHQSKLTQLLRRALQVDGLVVGLSGIVLIVGAGPLTAFLGLNLPLILVVMGLVFVLYGGAVLWAATR